MYIRRQLRNSRSRDPNLATKRHTKHKITFVLCVPLCGNKFSEYTLLTFAISAVTAEIAAAGVLELAVAFRADADHVGHDGARDGPLRRVMVGVLLARDSAGRVRQVLNTTHRDHDALRDCLLW